MASKLKDEKNAIKKKIEALVGLVDGKEVKSKYVE